VPGSYLAHSCRPVGCAGYNLPNSIIPCQSVSVRCAHYRLLDVAAAGKERVLPEELLQNRLLKELKALPQVRDTHSHCAAQCAAAVLTLLW
jgi:hypothetical protein